MIRVKISKDTLGSIVGVRCEGHAGYAASGNDIICSAVSVLVVNTINSIEQFTDAAFSCDTNEKLGLIDFKLTDKADEKSALLLNSLELGLMGIRQEYGDRFINISIKEV